MSTGGRPERRWRPSDADRDRYVEAISRAYSDGRITVDDMQSRTALVYDAVTIADLDAIVDDIPSARASSAPGPPVEASRRLKQMVLVGVLLALGIAGAGAALFSVSADETPRSGAEVEEAADGPPEVEPIDVDLPEIATEKLSLLTEAGLAEMWATLGADGATEIQSITVRADWAEIVVRANTDQLGLDRFKYEGGMATRPEWYRSYSEAESGFYGWGDVSPDVLARVLEASPDAADVPDGVATLAWIQRSVFHDDDVVLSVRVEGGAVDRNVTWTADGTAVLRTS